MKKHTPGPWMSYKDQNSIGIYMRDDDGTCGPQVAEVLLETLEGDTDEQAHADARLIASAPELLSALKRLWESSRSEPVGKDGKDCWLVSPEALENARLVIAKTEER